MTLRLSDGLCRCILDRRRVCYGAEAMSYEMTALLGEGSYRRQSYLERPECSLFRSSVWLGLSSLHERNAVLTTNYSEMSGLGLLSTSV